MATFILGPPHLDTWKWMWSQLSPDEQRRRVEASTVDPEDHDYQGDGTSRCPVCLGQMNDHISWGKS